MQDVAGKTAFITGGASGIGFAMARTFLGAGMRVVIADIDEGALADAKAALEGANSEVFAVQLDVTDREQYAAVADQVEQEFGPVDVLCNNAGVYRGGDIGSVTYEDWDWVMGVNVGGVVNGVQTFVSRMQARGNGGHIVNTASMAGMSTSPGLGVYNTSKFAVVGLSEAMQGDLAGSDIGVSVLCPGMVRTRILESERTRPDGLAPDSQAAENAAQTHNQIMQLAMGAGIDADEVSELVLHGVRHNELYLFPHPEMKEATAARFGHILDAFGEADPERLKLQEELMAGLLKD
ncbi:MAG: SDR family NAD(P)-dependent oxidoreductase [Pseudomonadales bacterium]